MRRRPDGCPAMATALAALALVAPIGPATATGQDRRDDASPWGISVSAEWSDQYPRSNPMLRDAGVRWLRLFPEWHTIQPRPGEWDWKAADAVIASARANGIHPIGVWAYLAPWASADGTARKFPIKDIRHWSDHVAGTVGHRREDVKYWEVWNEFNGSFSDSRDKVKDYAQLVATAYDAAKKADPTAQVGMSVANFDVGFLDAVIRAVAADHFDFLCVHPYENLAAVAEVGYLSLAGNLRKMLAANTQREDMPLWITETGYGAPIRTEPRADARQAEMLVKGYLLSLAQGFDRVFWFEIRGPSYGGGDDLGLIRHDWTPRPAYRALRTMTALLGPSPRYLGWLDLDGGGYGFLFRGEKGDVLAAWSPEGRERRIKFEGETGVTDFTGEASALPAGRELLLSPAPVFVDRVPAGMVERARLNLGKPYPWGGDYGNAKVVTCRLAAVNREDGLKQVSPRTTVVVNDLTESYRRPSFADPALGGEGRYLYFRVDPGFVPFGTNDLDVTIVARRLEPGKDAAIDLSYESMKGYVGTGRVWTIPKGDGWHEHTWTVGDANFVGQWGWNFRLDATGSPEEFLVREVRVSKPAREKTSTGRGAKAPEGSTLAARRGKPGRCGRSWATGWTRRPVNWRGRRATRHGRPPQRPPGARVPEVGKGGPRPAHPPLRGDGPRGQGRRPAPEGCPATRRQTGRPGMPSDGGPSIRRAVDVGQIEIRSTMSRVTFRRLRS